MHQCVQGADPEKHPDRDEAVVTHRRGRTKAVSLVMRTAGHDASSILISLLSRPDPGTPNLSGKFFRHSSDDVRPELAWGTAPRHLGGSIHLERPVLHPKPLSACSLRQQSPPPFAGDACQHIPRHKSTVSAKSRLPRSRTGSTTPVPGF